MTPAGTALAPHGAMRTLLAIASLLATLVSAASAGPAATDDPDHATYLRYCGACHGPAGKGDGVAGTFMNPKPTDLTGIAKKNGGDFPFARVMEQIDGTTVVRAHGDPDMPVWGEVFRSQSAWDATRRADVRGKLLLITEHLRSIQEK
jgi:mono/diheme cytochrome c family protein